MYIVTFYSFKGGVGRTMAMANVGLSLARAGRRVLLVDFDLEAPGLDTFDLLRPSEPTPGLVDFVTEYRNTRVAPDVKRFLYEPSHPGLDASVWVMPTGKQGVDYGNRLNAIDWPQLYAEEDGYLLFEDLKEQWSRELRPDYVLIDSRTGHTDVGGICTRQLPHAVVLLFFPNEQNRRGLETVVRDINRESQESRGPIDTYFVAANVPDLDDEDSILRREMGAFQRAMERVQRARGRFPDATIHHYDSLLLLQQTVFTIERPRTKLAREYERLAKVITSSNLGDRSVVTEFLDDLPMRRAPWQDLESIDSRLKKIQSLYAEDGAVLYALGQAHRNLGRGREAGQFLERAARFGFRSEESMADEAAKEYSIGALEAARQSVRRALDLTTKHVFPVARLLQIVAANDDELLPETFRTLEAKGIGAEDRLYIVKNLGVKRGALGAVADFLRPLAAADDPSQEAARSELSLCLIGQRRFAEAEVTILAARNSAELAIQDSFNYAMSRWGKTRTIPRDVFLQVIGLAGVSPQNLGANYLQCLAISNWAVGRVDAARQFSARSRLALEGTELEFSAWRYLRVPGVEFLHDLDLMDKMIDTGQGQPELIGDHDDQLV